MTKPLTNRSSRGAVLILGLVILLVMTMLAVAAIQSTALEERMAGNMRQRDLALHSAEAAAQLAMTLIEPQVAAIAPSATNGAWEACELGDDVTTCDVHSERINDWRAQGEAGSYSKGYLEVPDLGIFPSGLNVKALTGVADQPRLAIDVQFVPVFDVEGASKGAGVHYYTITALGVGADANARAIVETIVARVYQW